MPKTIIWPHPSGLVLCVPKDAVMMGKHNCDTAYVRRLIRIRSFNEHLQTKGPILALDITITHGHLTEWPIHQANKLSALASFVSLMTLGL